MTNDPTQRHHEGLPNDQVRDLLAAEIRSSPDVQMSLYADDGKLREILVRNVEQAQAKLDAHDKARGLKQIMDQFGWKEHDISDYVDYDQTTYRPFIGTEAERKERYPDETNRRRRRRRR